MGVCFSENLKSEKINVFKANIKKGEIIEEGNTNNAPPISERASKKLYNSIFRISFTYNGKNIIGTGFFIKLNLKPRIK